MNIVQAMGKGVQIHRVSATKGTKYYPNPFHHNMVHVCVVAYMCVPTCVKYLIVHANSRSRQWSLIDHRTFRSERWNQYTVGQSLLKFSLWYMYQLWAETITRQSLNSCNPNQQPLLDCIDIAAGKWLLLLLFIQFSMDGGTDQNYMYILHLTNKHLLLYFTLYVLQLAGVVWFPLKLIKQAVCDKLSGGWLKTTSNLGSHDSQKENLFHT